MTVDGELTWATAGGPDALDGVSSRIRPATATPIISTTTMASAPSDHLGWRSVEPWASNVDRGPSIEPVINHAFPAARIAALCARLPSW